MAGFAVDDDREIFASQFLRPVPHLLYKRTRSIVLLNFNSFIQQKLFNFQRCAKGRDNHHVFARNLIPGNQLRSICIHDKADAPALQVAVHFLVVNHLTEQIHLPSRIFFDSPVTYFNGVLNAIAKPEVTRQNEPYRPKIQFGRSEILLAQILEASGFFYAAGDG